MSKDELWRYVCVGVLLGMLVVVGTATLPQTGWAPPLIKIGVVNWEQVILQYEGYQQELKALQDKRQRILQFIEQEYGNIDEDSIKKKSESKSTNGELESLYQDTLKQHEERRQQTIDEYHQKIMSAIREEAIEQGFSLILSENEVLYAAEGYTDLTNGVINRLNDEN